jgi:hypothetical protein
MSLRVVLLVVLIGVASACASGLAQTPLPNDVTVVAPPANTPKGVAAFSGRWAGLWGNTLDHLLVVEKIEGRNATFVYSWGTAPVWNITTPGFQRVTGTVGDDGVLRGTLGNGAEVAYKLSRDQKTLSGEYVLRGRTTLGSFNRQ